MNMKDLTLLEKMKLFRQRTSGTEDLQEATQEANKIFSLADWKAIRGRAERGFDKDAPEDPNKIPAAHCQLVGALLAFIDFFMHTWQEAKSVVSECKTNAQKRSSWVLWLMDPSFTSRWSKMSSSIQHSTKVEKTIKPESRTTMLQRYTESELEDLLATGAVTRQQHPQCRTVWQYFDHSVWCKTTSMAKDKTLVTESTKESTEEDFSSLDQLMSQSLDMDSSIMSMEGWMQGSSASSSHSSSSSNTAKGKVLAIRDKDKETKTKDPQVLFNADQHGVARKRNKSMASYSYCEVGELSKAKKALMLLVMAQTEMRQLKPKSKGVLRSKVAPLVISESLFMLSINFALASCQSTLNPLTMYLPGRWVAGRSHCLPDAVV